MISQSTLKAGGTDKEETSVDREEGESTVASTEHSDAITQDTVETHSTSTSSKYSIPWVKSLGYLRLYHDEDLDGEVFTLGAGYQQRRREVDSILEDLEGILSQLPVQSQKVGGDVGVAWAEFVTTASIIVDSGKSLGRTLH